MIKGRAYVTAKTVQSFEGEDEEDIKRKALALFRKDILDGDLRAWVDVEIIIQSSTTNQFRDKKGLLI